VLKQRREVHLEAERRSGWLLAAGLALGGLIGTLGGREAFWYVLGLALIVAVASLLLRRSRQSGATPVQTGAPGLSLPQPAAEVFEHLPDPILLLDASGRVVFANRSMRAVVGLDAQRKHVSAVFRTPVVLQAIDRTIATGEPASVEFTVHVPVERNYEAHVSRTAHPPQVTALLLHDLTATKRAEEARADFVANASHELRTPLAAVSGFIDTLKGHAKDDPEAREKFLDIMSVEAGRMRRLIDDLLSLTRIEQNEHVPPSGRVDLGAVVRDAVAALSPLAEADEVTIAIEEAPGLPPVTGQRDELIQLFQNLIHNAIKYGRHGGHVWLKLAASSALGRRGGGAMVSVTIRDDGEGIPREAIPRLTERFYRVDVKRSRERGGTGLGLAIVKHIINRHQGRLQIESQPGQGSSFTVTLPVAKAQEAARASVTEVL
jgi:two-component system phosphate regulon sensor histidine kinase PhoR